MVRGELMLAVGHQGHLMRVYVEHELHKLPYRVTLDIHLRGDERSQVIHILIAYMTFVGTGVDSDALRTKLFAVGSHHEHIGIIAAARVA